MMASALSMRAQAQSPVRRGAACRAACRWPTLECGCGRNSDCHPTARVLVCCLLDGHSLAYRAFFALPVENFSTTTGQPTNAVYGFTSMLINVLRDEAPTHIAVAFDVSRQTFRSEEYTEYKANRSTSPSEFKGQVSLVKEVLDALRVVTVDKDGFEADDVIATLATQAEAAGMDVLICSGDRDAFQLVTDHVTVLYPKRGVSDLARMTPAAVEEQLRRRARDSTPTSPRWSARRATTCPASPGSGRRPPRSGSTSSASLDEIIARVDEIPGKAGESLRERPGRRDPQPPDQRAGPRPRAAGRASPTCSSSRGTATRCTRSSTVSSSGCLRDRLFETLSVDEPKRSRDAVELDASELGAGRGRRAGWPSTQPAC